MVQKSITPLTNRKKEPETRIQQTEWITTAIQNVVFYSESRILATDSLKNRYPKFSYSFSYM